MLHLNSPDFDALYEAHSAMVYWTAYGLSHNHDAAIDVTQTVFMRAFEQWGTISALLPPQAKSWLYKAARNAAIDILRKEKRVVLSDILPESADLDERTSPESELMRSEREHDVWTFVAVLPEIYRAPIILHYFAGLTQKEAAATLKLSGGTYRSRLARGKAMLERLLRENELSGTGEEWYA